MIEKLFYLLEKLSENRTILSFIIRKIFRDSNFLSIEKTIKLNASSRPAYLYCAYRAAQLAKKLGHKKISFIEFGVAEGNGLNFLEKISARIEKELDVEIELYGFDTGEGLFEPQDYKDLGYFFKSSMYKMNKEKLNKNLIKSKLILGDVKDTVKNFFERYNPPPIAAIFNDLDFYSSTINSFEIFKGDNKHFLPRIFCYFDDIVGSEYEMYNEFSGELLAINEFNKANDNKKICLNRNLLSLNSHSWRHQIYYFHNFNHQDYNKYIGEEEQKKIKSSIQLKN